MEAAAYQVKLLAVIEKLTTSITKLASYEPPAADVNYDKFKIQISPVSISDIIDAQ